MFCQSLLYSKVTQIYTYIHSFFIFFFHNGLSQGIEYSSLCYTLGPCCLPILNVVVCIYSFYLLIEYPALQIINCMFSSRKKHWLERKDPETPAPEIFGVRIWSNLSFKFYPLCLEWVMQIEVRRLYCFFTNPQRMVDVCGMQLLLLFYLSTYLFLFLHAPERMSRGGTQTSHI